MENEEVYIIGNGLEGVIAFEKAADENSKGEVKINGAIISSQTITVNTNAVQSQALVGTVVFSGFNVDVQAGYVEQGDVSGADSSFPLEIVASLPVPIQPTLTASYSKVTAPAGYYYKSATKTVRAGGLEVAQIGTPTSNIVVDSNLSSGNNYQIKTTFEVISDIGTTVTTSGWIESPDSSQFTYTNSNIVSIPKGTALTLDSAANPPTVTAPIGWYKTAVNTTIPTANTFTLSTATPTIPTLTTGKGWYDTVTYTIPTGTVAVNPTVTFSTFNVSTNTTNSGHLQVEVVASANRAAQNIHAWVPTVAKILRSGTSNFDVDLSSIDVNFQASSIASGITVFGVKGTAGQEAPNVTVPSTLTGTDPSTKTPAATGIVTFNTTLNSVSPEVISGTVQATPTDVTLQVTGSIPVFTGSTAIIPATTPVTITAANKWMPSNLTVAAIPTYTGAKTFYPTGSNQTVNISNLYATQSLTVGSVVVTGLDSNTILSTATINIGNASDAIGVTSVTGNIQSYTPSGDVIPSTQPINIAVGGKYVTSNITIASLSAYTSDNFNDDISAAQGV